MDVYTTCIYNVHTTYILMFCGILMMKLADWDVIDDFLKGNATLEYSKNRKKFFLLKLYLKILRFDEFYDGEKLLNAYSG